MLTNLYNYYIIIIVNKGGDHMINKHYFKNMVPGAFSLGCCIEVSSEDFEKIIIDNNNEFISTRFRRDLYDVIFYYNQNSDLIGYIKECRI